MTLDIDRTPHRGPQLVGRDATGSSANALAMQVDERRQILCRKWPPLRWSIAVSACSRLTLTPLPSATYRELSGGRSLTVDSCGVLDDRGNMSGQAGFVELELELELDCHGHRLPGTSWRARSDVVQTDLCDRLCTIKQPHSFTLHHYRA